MAGSAGPPGGNNPFELFPRFWREYTTQCANCAQLEKRKRGFLFTGMTPSGEMKTFCNADCCNEWEQKDDNTNSRREAIKAQRAKKKNDAPSR